MKRSLSLLLFVPVSSLAQCRQPLAIAQKASTVTWAGHAEVGTYAPSGSLSIREVQITLEKWLRA